jgi:hypothetical protein
MLVIGSARRGFGKAPAIETAYREFRVLPRASADILQHPRNHGKLLPFTLPRARAEVS